eukprot:TRINITY_DN1212_c0_g1_i1.p1 TRINITY_DN1212_c0_g1~~TRINITY_DN1212_c0_g1_i1.p1  ORF type:complete len:195 (-),score=52.57 TRINITY_DN1212_c0_g1_i1:79-663(-)
MKIAVLLAALSLIAYATAEVVECGRSPSGCIFPSGTYDCSVEVPGQGTIEYRVTSLEMDGLFDSGCESRMTTADGACNRVLDLEVLSNGDLALDYEEDTCNDPMCPFTCDDSDAPVTGAGDLTGDGYCNYIQFNAQFGDAQLASRCDLQAIAGSVPSAPISYGSRLSRRSAASTLVPTAALAVVAIVGFAAAWL